MLHDTLNGLINAIFIVIIFLLQRIHILRLLSRFFLLGTK